MKYDELLFARYFEDWSKLPAAKIKSLLGVKTKTVIPNLDSIDFSKNLRVKWGIDPTGSDIHIGHLCPVFVMNIFLKSGHHIDFLIGDFTAKIGDPSGRVTERAVITDEQIAQNFATYKLQIAKFIDESKLHVYFNSNGLSKVTLADILGIGQNLNMATILQREDFRTRLSNGGLTLAETLYGTLQALDSVHLKSDVELGGVDQLLNLQQAREIQRMHGQPPQVIVTTPILEGTDGTGRKMSKSYGNYIAVNASAEDKFGKFMSIPDSLLLQYYKSFGYLYENEIADMEKFIAAHPMEAKKQLATYFVSIESRDLKTGLTEREKFENKFSKKELTSDDFYPVSVTLGTMLSDALFASNRFSSKGEIKRLFAGGAVRDVDKNTVIAADTPVNTNLRVKVGKLNFISINIKK